MSLNALVLCSDEKIVRVLRRVLSELEIGIQHCLEPDSAIRKLTRTRFEAVIVDSSDLKTATAVLKSARSAPCNKRAIAVAIMDGHTGLRTAFDMGAHFVLYKPVSAERAKASFRAARALMKRERRRNSRVAVQIPVTLQNSAGNPRKAVTHDFSEGGLAIQLPKGQKETGPWKLTFSLPGSSDVFSIKGEAAWQNPNGQIGIRFTDLTVDLAHTLRVWLNENSPESEQDDPPVGCKLTDLSLGGCYLELTSPFPVRTRIVLSMKTAELELRAEGVVRVMHPEVGMGVEFTQATEEQRQHVEKFIQHLMASDGTLPELLVQPEGLEAASTETTTEKLETEDPLLELFHRKASLPAEVFLGELRKQRRSHAETAAEENILPV